MDDFNDRVTKSSFMKKAHPIWVEGMEEEYNLHVGFKTVLGSVGGKKVEVYIAAATMYRMFVNNEYVCFGPARGPKGYFRVDRIDVSQYITLEANIIAIEVVGQNSRSFSYVDQTSFFACEVHADGEVIKATGDNGDFNARIIKERVRKTQRFSFQRAFWESYRYEDGWDKWRRDADCNGDLASIAFTEEKVLIPRNVDYPLYEKRNVQSVVANGNVTLGNEPEKYYYGNSYLSPGEKYKLYSYEELEFCVTDEAQKMRFYPRDNKIELSDWYAFEENSYINVDMGLNATGMTAYEVITDKTVMVYCMFDELLVNGDVDFLRADVSNVLKVQFGPGQHKFIAFEPVGYKFVKIVVVGGDCKIGNFHMIEYKHPPVKYKVNIPKEKEKLNRIYDAAVENFRQNAVDIYMDCPSRERAGWLCDSFFTARTEYCLTGTSKVEYNFLENYLLPESFEFIPEGMFPMCYPADHPDGIYIPNWAMWLVCELEEYKNRNGDLELIEAYKPKIYKLCELFSKYENLNSLLEKLDGWIFVEWSKANELVQDVSYATNMVYAGMLEAVGRLYNDGNMLAKAEKIREMIRRLSYNGEFFTDNAVRVNGNLVNTNEVTEVCQYYAFFFKIATPASYPELWTSLLNKFGPERRENNNNPEIYFANAFIGNFLRLDTLMRYGETKKALEDIEGYFYMMAATTGTLWEHDDTRASCNHGFASHLVYWLENIYGKNPV